MRPIALLIEYDGTNYAGWQQQPNGIAVQKRIEEAVHFVFGEHTPVVGSGRTDAGVHARGQVAHVQLSNTAHAVPIEKVAVALNTRLPRDIRIRAAASVQGDFHARFHPVWREYVYWISREESVFNRHFSWYAELPFSQEQFIDAATVFEGKHDFTSFSKNNPDTASYICNVLHCSAEPHPDRLAVRIRADRFVYGMCRSIVGTMMAVARGKITHQDVLSGFDNPSRDHQQTLAPPQGLILNRVAYPTSLFDEYPSL